MAWKVGRVLFELVEGDIAALRVDAIANAANDRLWMGSGVAGAIKRAGGGEIEREAVAKGPIAIGEAVATAGGRLPAHWVLHAAVMGQDLRTSGQAIAKATTSTLALADELGAASLALPAFGTGVGGFPLEHCASLMVDAARDYVQRHPVGSLRRIVFATFGATASQAFGDALVAMRERPAADGLLYLSRAALRSLGLASGEIVDAVERAFVARGRGLTVMPPKLTLHGRGDDFSQVMAAAVHDEAAAGLGAKWVSLVPRNAERGLPTLNGLVVINDPLTGVPLAIMDAAQITRMRTGASVALAARLLAAPGTGTIGLLGCGVQGGGSIEALLAELPDVRLVLLYDERPEAIARLAGELVAAHVGLEVRGCTGPRQVLQGAGVVATAITMTPGAAPPLEAGWLEPGALAVALDYDAAWSAPAMAECDRFVVDDREQVLATRATGPRLSGIPSISADLSELAAGLVPGRIRQEERIFCLNLGVAIEDVAAGTLAYRRALELGVGTHLEL